jgi:rhodanese-related sulfurtransferase
MKQHSPRFLELVAAAAQSVLRTDVAAVRSRLDRGERFHLVDVREDAEWERGRIPGALHLGKGILERDVERVIPDPATPIVLYCGGGYRSVLAAEALARMGYSNVESMDGGYSGWVESGSEVETGQPEAPPAA